MFSSVDMILGLGKSLEYQIGNVNNLISDYLVEGDILCKTNSAGVQGKTEVVNYTQFNI